MRLSLVALAVIFSLFAACGGDSDTPSAPQADANSEAEAGSPEEAVPTEESAPEPDEEEQQEGDEGEVQNGEKVTAKVIDTAFEPRELTVKVGTTVTWKQIGDQPHSVTAVNGKFDSSPSCSPLKSEKCDFEGDTYSFTFKEAGTFDYYCRIHGLPTGRGMFATLTVEK